MNGLTSTPRVDRWRAATLKRGVRVCEWAHIGGCKGLLEVAHLDGNAFNNDPGNLKKLCRSHHSLLDRGTVGKIDAATPVMPMFYVDSGGKRRYGLSRADRSKMLTTRIVELLDQSPQRHFSPAAVAALLDEARPVVSATLAHLSGARGGPRRISRPSPGHYVSLRFALVAVRAEVLA